MPPLLILNAGPSSFKFSLFRGDESLALILSGDIDRIGSTQATFVLNGTGDPASEHGGISASEAFTGLLAGRNFGKLIIRTGPENPR